MCTHLCLIAAQKRTLKWRTTKTSRSSRRAFTSQLPVGLDEALLKISFRISMERLKTFVSIYRSVIVLCTRSCLCFEHCFDIFTYDVYHMCVNLILAHIWDAFGFFFLKPGVTVHTYIHTSTSDVSHSKSHYQSFLLASHGFDVCLSTILVHQSAREQEHWFRSHWSKWGGTPGASWCNWCRGNLQGLPYQPQEGYEWRGYKSNCKSMYMLNSFCKTFVLGPAHSVHATSYFFNIYGCPIFRWCIALTLFTSTNSICLCFQYFEYTPLFYTHQ